MSSGSESDNDMPEAVPFTNSKKLALKDIQDLKESLERDKSVRKLTQFEREQRNLRQKKNKLLSAELLRKADISIKQQEEKKQILNKIREDQISNEKALLDEQEELEEEQYINLNKISQKPADDAAKLFLQEKLHGKRIRRVDAKGRKRLQHKNKFSTFS